METRALARREGENDTETTTVAEPVMDPATVVAFSFRLGAGRSVSARRTGGAIAGTAGSSAAGTGCTTSPAGTTRCATVAAGGAIAAVAAGVASALSGTALTAGPAVTTRSADPVSTVATGRGAATALSLIHI